MKATFTYDKVTKTLSARGDGMEWNVVVADHVYVDIYDKPFSVTEEALMALDGTTEELKSPDGFEEVLNSVMKEPDVSMGCHVSPGIEGREVGFVQDPIGDKKVIEFGKERYEGYRIPEPISPFADFDDLMMVPGRATGSASVTSIEHMGPSLLRSLHAGDSPTIKATSRKPTSIKTFDTWDRAWGFVDGVEFVNDSALDAIVDLNAKTPTVVIFDRDAETKED